MRDDIILKLQRIIEGNDKITWEYFPAVYDGFVEADELSLAEDKMLQLIASAVQTATDDKIISTAGSDKISEYEEQLGLFPGSMTLEERRQQVIDFINRSRVINEEDLLALVQSVDGGETNSIEVNPRWLLLRIKKISNSVSDDEMSDLVNAWHTVQPVIPQNLNVELKVESDMQKELYATYCGISWLRTNIGHVERHIVGDHGFMSETGDVEFQSEHGVVDRPTGLYTNTLVEHGPGEYGTIQMAQEIRGYLRAASYQTANKSVTANSSNYLYGQGESGFLASESGKTYTLTGAYTNADASVDITGCSISVTSGNVKLEWGLTAANVCYVTISVV